MTTILHISSPGPQPDPFFSAGTRLLEPELCHPLGSGSGLTCSLSLFVSGPILTLALALALTLTLTLTLQDPYQAGEYERSIKRSQPYLDLNCNPISK